MISKQTQELRRIIYKYDVSTLEVAKLLDISVHTVNKYKSKRGIDIPDNLLELLSLKLEQRELH